MSIIKQIAIIDNNDSFTYNLVQLFKQSPSCQITVCPYGDFCVDSLEKYDQIVLSPGAHTPEQYPKLFQLINRYKYHKPILGVCLGHQVIGVYFGAELENLPDVYHGRQTTLSLSASVDSVVFKDLPVDSKVGLYHSWAVKNQNLGQELSVTAYSEQGIIMGLKHREFLIEGIQFHPESYMSTSGQLMIDNWVGQQGYKK